MKKMKFWRVWGKQNGVHGFPQARVLGALSPLPTLKNSFELKTRTK